MAKLSNVVLEGFGLDKYNDPLCKYVINFGADIVESSKSMNQDACIFVVRYKLEYSFVLKSLNPDKANGKLKENPSW
jgi:hypothetical protein